MKNYIIAHDLGTSGNKATLFSEEGKLIASVLHSYDTHYFNEIWVEQDANEWWNAVCNSTQSLITKTGINKEDIKVVSFSGQMMGCLCVDDRGIPLRPSIIWADQRSSTQCKQLEERIAQKDFYRITGHRNTPSYGIQKLMWIRDNEPDIYERTAKVLNAKDFIVHQLTGKFYTEPTDANSMACYDLCTGQWSDTILEYAGIDKSKLPEIVPSTFVAGNVTEEAAKLTGMSTNTLVVMGGGDGVVANIGCGSIAPGKAYCCLGTSAWVATTTDTPVYDEEMRVITWAHVIPGMYSPNGTMQYAGGSYSWLKNVVCKEDIEKAKETGESPFTYMNEEIEKSQIGSNGVMFLPYMLGERAPRWDIYAKGTWLGLKPENTKGDLLRSVLEGVTYNLAICLDILKKNTDIDELLIIGGGAKGKVWRKMFADICNVKVCVPKVLEEAGSMGAAVIAGVGIGLYEDFTAIDRFIEIQERVNPSQEAVKKYTAYKEDFEDYYQAVKDVYRKVVLRRNI